MGVSLEVKFIKENERKATYISVKPIVFRASEVNIASLELVLNVRRFPGIFLFVLARKRNKYLGHFEYFIIKPDAGWDRIRSNRNQERH